MWHTSSYICWSPDVLPPFVIYNTDCQMLFWVCLCTIYTKSKSLFQYIYSCRYASLWRKTNLQLSTWLKHMSHFFLLAREILWKWKFCKKKYTTISHELCSKNSLVFFLSENKLIKHTTIPKMVSDLDS